MSEEIRFSETGLPYIESPVYRTAAGTPYLKEAGVAMISRPHVDLSGVQTFLDGFDDDLGFEGYLDDPTDLPPAEQLVKFMGQACYLSFGEARSWNKDAKKYFDNLKSSGHGSVFEHANFSFFIWGIDRSVTHELVRHRAGFGFCLDGDTEVYSDRFCNGIREGVQKRKISDLFAMTKSGYGRSRLKLLRLRCLDEVSGVFTQGAVAAVVESGIKPVFRVDLEDGKTITCSKDHRFLTPDGWASLDTIVGGLDVSSSGMAVYGRLGGELMVNGVEAYKDRQWLSDRYVAEGRSQEEIAAMAGVSVHTVRSWVRKYGIQKTVGSWAVGVVPWNKGKRYRASAPMSDEQKDAIRRRMSGSGNHRWRGGVTREAIALRQPIERYREEILARDGYRCRLCGKRSNRLEMHHIIPIWADKSLADKVDNIASVCRRCHREMAGKELLYVERFQVSPPAIAAQPIKGRGNLMVPRPRKIIGITYVGERMTYDLEMAGANHNFVANGIVTHNSQCSQRYVDGTKLRFVERPEYQDANVAIPEDALLGPEQADGWCGLLRTIKDLHCLFERSIDEAKERYDLRAHLLMRARELGHPMLQGGSKTEVRKQVNQVAREGLPNSAEAPIGVTANVRALRHMIEMRASSPADVQIRAMAMKLYRCVRHVSPMLFDDYVVTDLAASCTQAIETPTRKV